MNKTKYLQPVFQKKKEKGRRKLLRVSILKTHIFMYYILFLTGNLDRSTIHKVHDSGSLDNKYGENRHREKRCFRLPTQSSFSDLFLLDFPFLLGYR